MSLELIPKVYIIDWNLGLSLADARTAQEPEGAVAVHGFAVALARSQRDAYLYTPSDDLQSLVRAVYLLLNPVKLSAVVEVRALCRGFGFCQSFLKYIYIKFSSCTGKNSIVIFFTC